jgi:restriction endonuclease Mrr
MDRRRPKIRIGKPTRTLLPDRFKFPEKTPPDSFERLARRLLREAGFVSVTVTGKSGDGGIDGIGVYRLSLVSFPVFFQCKRYKGGVGAGAVRDFRGAMSGRGALAQHQLPIGGGI